MSDESQMDVDYDVNKTSTTLANSVTSNDATTDNCGDATT